MNVKNYYKKIINSKKVSVFRYYLYTLIFLLFSAGLTGCTSVEYVDVPLERTPLNLEQPKTLNPREIKWHVITPENQEEKFKELQEKDGVLFGLTDEDYENLSLNMLELRSYIIQQNLIIKSYKDYYEDSSNEKEKSN